MFYTFHFTLTFILVYLLRLIHHRLTTRLALRNIPGPKCSSWIWGEEHKLYYSTPGVHYVEWHRSFGSVVAFPGAFGVSLLGRSARLSVSFTCQASHFVYHRPQSHKLYSR